MGVIQCNVKDEVPMDKSDSDGTALLVATDCPDEITMCMNMTVMDTDKKITGTKFACGVADKTAGCTIADGKKPAIVKEQNVTHTQWPISTVQLSLFQLRLCSFL